MSLDLTLAGLNIVSWIKFTKYMSENYAWNFVIPVSDRSREQAVFIALCISSRKDSHGTTQEVEVQMETFWKCSWWKRY